MFYLLFAILALLYLLPSIVVIHNDHPLGLSIMVLNLFFGWTVIGWLIALLLAFHKVDCPPLPAAIHPRRQAHHQGKDKLC